MKIHELHTYSLGHWIRVGLFTGFFVISSSVMLWFVKPALQINKVNGMCTQHYAARVVASPEAVANHCAEVIDRHRVSCREISAPWLFNWKIDEFRDCLRQSYELRRASFERLPAPRDPNAAKQAKKAPEPGRLKGVQPRGFNPLRPFGGRPDANP